MHCVSYEAGEILTDERDGEHSGVLGQLISERRPRGLS